MGTPDEWLAARRELLVREKELTRLGDELARQRMALPWVPMDKEYVFATEGTAPGSSSATAPTTTSAASTTRRTSCRA